MGKYKTAKTIEKFDFIKMLGTEDKARKYLESILWKNGRICPNCNIVNNSTACKNKDGFYQCKGCRKEFSVRHGTLFASSKLPLYTWLHAMYLIQTTPYGISSLQLGKKLNITQKTVLFLLQRLQEVCKTESSDLYGIVELEEIKQPKQIA